MGKRLRTLLFAIPLFALASCQVVSGLSGVDLEGGTSGGTSGGQAGVCSTPPNVDFSACNEMFADEDLTAKGCTVVKTKAQCDGLCAKESFAGYCAQPLSKNQCTLQKQPKCVASCHKSCACPGKSANCFEACNAWCDQSCNDSNEPSCSASCAGSCATACGKAGAGCDEACAGACTAVANLPCLEAGLARCIKGAEGICPNICGSFDCGPPVFCGGQYMGAEVEACTSSLKKAGIKVD